MGVGVSTKLIPLDLGVDVSVGVGVKTPFGRGCEGCEGGPLGVTAPSPPTST